MRKTQQTSEFEKAFRAIRDARAKQKILVRIDRLELGNAGDFRNLTNGVNEMRIDYGPGYRVYYSMRGAELILLLLCGDKTTQDRDIAKAIALNSE
jgi:putative addiction module killer protein